MIAKIYSQLMGYSIESILHHKHCSSPWRVLSRLLARRSVPCVLFSHGHHNGRIAQGNYFPRGKYQGKRVFLLARDPRDVVVSHYYYSRWQHGAFDGTISEFIRYPSSSVDWKSRQARFGIRPVINYMNAWVRNSSAFSGFHVAHYEDFKEDVDLQLRLLCGYIGIDVSADLLKDAIAFGNFDNVRRMELDGSLNWHGLQGSKDPRALKTRKGIVGGYKHELSRRDIDFIEQEIDDRLDEFFRKYKFRQQ